MEAKPVIYRPRRLQQPEPLDDDRAAQTVQSSAEPVVIRPSTEPARPTQLPAFRKQEQAETRAIAHRVRDTSRSYELERLLNQQRNKQAKLPDGSSSL